MTVSNPLISIIVPTHNEEDDIAHTMDALAASPYHPLEVIVVDASKDRTPEIVRSYEARIQGLRLVPQGPKPGVSAARNVGLRMAHGEIVLILNADIPPQPDFFDRILPHYQQGADYLVVNSQSSNPHTVYARFVQAQHEYMLEKTWQDTNWCEGFTCRREAALAVGGFPEEFAHNTAGEDAIFGDRLGALFKRAADFSIVVPRIDPDTYGKFMYQRIQRARGGPYVLYVHEQRPMCWSRVLRSVIGTLALGLIGIPSLFDGWRLSRYSPRGWRDWLPFTYARFLEFLGTAYGHWNACREIARRRKQRDTPAVLASE